MEGSNLRTNTEQEWDLEIKPKPNLFDLNFAEIWRYKDLMLLFVKRDFIAQYKQTILGPFGILYSRFSRPSCFF